MAKRPFSELDEAANVGASIDAYPPRMVARMAAAPANVNYVKRQMPAPEAPAPAPQNGGERLRQVQNIAGAGANPQAFIQQQAPKVPRGRPDPNVSADTTKIVDRQRKGALGTRVGDMLRTGLPDVGDAILSRAEGALNSATLPVRQLIGTGADVRQAYDGKAPRANAGAPAPGFTLDRMQRSSDEPLSEQAAEAEGDAAARAAGKGDRRGGKAPATSKPESELTDQERADNAGRAAAQNYLSERKPLAAGVQRYDAGMDTPSQVYATVDKNGNRVYTDNANYAASVTDGVGRMQRNAQTEVREADIAADTNRGFEYTAPIADLNGIAEMRRSLPNLPAGTRQAIEAALPEAERAANIEAARTGTRPVDLRRKAEGADLTAGKNLYRPPGADTAGALTPYQMLQTQLGMMDRQGRAEETAYNRARDAEEDTRRAAQDAAGATQAEQARMDKDLSTVMAIQKTLNEVDKDGFPVADPADLLAPVMTMIPEDPDAAQDFLTNNPAGQQIAKMYDEMLTRQARQQGGYFSRLDDDVRVDAGDMRFENPGDSSSNMYFEEGDEGLFGLTGRAQLGSVAQQAQRASTTPNRISALIRNRQTQQQRTERK